MKERKKVEGGLIAMEVNIVDIVAVAIVTIIIILAILQLLLLLLCRISIRIEEVIVV